MLKNVLAVFGGFVVVWLMVCFVGGMILGYKNIHNAAETVRMYEEQTGYDYDYEMLDPVTGEFRMFPVDENGEEL